MNNIEKYEKEITERVNNGLYLDCSIAHVAGIENGDICVFECSKCHKRLVEWMYSEYKEPILTDHDKQDVMKSSQIRKLIEEHPEQAFVCMEEPAELIQAISKCERSKMGDSFAQEDIDNLCEEIADVQIIIRILIQKYRLDVNRIKRWKDTKEKRIVKRYGL